MSYCRFGEDSDVYVFENNNGYYECCACMFEEGYNSYRTVKTKDMINHMKKHEKMGHKVPKRVIQHLEEELKNGIKMIKRKGFSQTTL